MDVVSAAIKIVTEIYDWKRMIITAELIIVTWCLTHFADWEFAPAIGVAILVGALISFTFEKVEKNRKARIIKSNGEQFRKEIDNISIRQNKRLRDFWK